MTAKFHGLAIGGIKDGQYLTHDSNVLRIPNPDGEVVLLADGRRAAIQPNLFHSYVFVSRYWWPLKEGKMIPGLTTILDVLDKSYHDQRRANENVKVPE